MDCAENAFQEYMPSHYTPGYRHFKCRHCGYTFAQSTRCRDLYEQQVHEELRQESFTDHIRFDHPNLVCDYA